MTEREIKFKLQVFSSVTELPAGDAELVGAARKALPDAYAPYSHFRVAAAIQLENGKVVTGTNQENASFPVGICAEGTALSAASSLYPGVAVKKIVITAASGTKKTDHPVAPCGICRQRLLEYEYRSNSDIQIIMAGEEGEVYSVSTVKDLLPLNFSAKEL